MWAQSSLGAEYNTSCTESCDSTHFDCDGDLGSITFSSINGSNGCEITEDSDYLGSAGTNATETSCTVATCKSGYIDCDDASNNSNENRTDTDGCEVQQSSAVGDGFPHAQYITSGTGYPSAGGQQCGIECNSGYISCDSS